MAFGDNERMAGRHRKLVGYDVGQLCFQNDGPIGRNRAKQAAGLTHLVQTLVSAEIRIVLVTFPGIAPVTQGLQVVQFISTTEAAGLDVINFQRQFRR